jgi:hypothetical protein
MLISKSQYNPQAQAPGKPNPRPGARKQKARGSTSLVQLSRPISEAHTISLSCAASKRPALPPLLHNPSQNPCTLSSERRKKTSLDAHAVRCDVMQRAQARSATAVLQVRQFWHSRVSGVQILRLRDAGLNCAFCALLMRRLIACSFRRT